MKPIQTEPIPVVVIGGSLTALGVVRSLVPGGMRIYVVERTSLCPGGWSRFCELVTVPTLEGRPLVDALKSLAARIGERAVLILTDDRAVETVSAFQEELEPLFRISLPPRARVLQLADKARFQEFAEQCGLPVPRSATLQSRADFGLLENLSLPLVIKPSNKAMSLNGRVERAERADSIEAARAITSTMLDAAGSVIAQEWIDGPDTNIYFTLFTCDRNGGITALFSGQKILCDPPRVGNTAVCIDAGDASAELERLTRQFLSLVEYRGLGSLEVKRDVRTGKFVIVEPTVGRADWQEEIATLCGVNIPLIAYRTELGEATEKDRPHPIRRAAWRSSRRQRPRRGQLPSGTKLQGGYFRPSDPLPAFYYYGFERFAGRALTLARRSARRLANALG